MESSWGLHPPLMNALFTDGRQAQVKNENCQVENSPRLAELKIIGAKPKQDRKILEDNERFLRPRSEGCCFA